MHVGGQREETGVCRLPSGVFTHIIWCIHSYLLVYSLTVYTWCRAREFIFINRNILRNQSCSLGIEERGINILTRRQ